MIFVNYRTNFNSSFANRGMALENDINETNKYYREYDIALVYKKPTPIRITKTNYQNMRVTDGFFECPSTLDYNGVYKGYYIEYSEVLNFLLKFGELWLNCCGSPFFFNFILLLKKLILIL